MLAGAALEEEGEGSLKNRPCWVDGVGVVLLLLPPLLLVMSSLMVAERVRRWPFAARGDRPVDWIMTWMTMMCRSSLEPYCWCCCCRCCVCNYTRSLRRNWTEVDNNVTGRCMCVSGRALVLLLVAEL